MSVSVSTTSNTIAPQECIGQRYLLPEGFSPSPDDVMIGRGKKVIAHNTNFYKIIESEMEAYKAAGSKALKSNILVRVLKRVKEEAGGRFVKLDAASGRWTAVEDTLGRTTIAQAFRDALHTTYRSSKQFKQRKRKQAKVVSVPPAMNVLDCARLCMAQQRTAFPVASAPAVLPVQPPSQVDSMARLRNILDEVTDLFGDDDDFAPLPVSAARTLPALALNKDLGGSMPSLDGAFSASEIAASCDLIVSDSLFSLDAPLPFGCEPTPIKQESNDFSCSSLGQLDIGDITAALAA